MTKWRCQRHDAVVPAGGTLVLWSAWLEPSSPEPWRLARCLTPERFDTSRAFLRSLLARYVDAAPRGLGFRYGPQGKPMLADAGSDLRFTLAHSGALAVCAVAVAMDVSAAGTGGSGGRRIR